MDVAGTQLPLFGTQATLFYGKDDHLRALQAKVVPPQEFKLPQAATAKVSPSEAAKIVSQQLGLPEEAAIAADAKLGVFLKATDPAQGHLAYQFQIPMGPAGSHIDVYLDAQTQEFLAVK